mgnify:CR=1 FL=1
MSITNIIQKSTTEIRLAICQFDADEKAKEELTSVVNHAMEAILEAAVKKKKPKKKKKIKKTRTARSFFADEVRARLKDDGESVKFVTATISREWKELKNKPEKEKYTDMCKADKARYESEIAESGQVIVKPFRGVTLYVCFSNKHRSDVIDQGFKGRACTPKLAAMWKEFKNSEGVKDTDAWKELEGMKKKIDDEKRAVEAVDEPVVEAVDEPVVEAVDEPVVEAVDDTFIIPESNEEYASRMQKYEDETSGFIPNDLWKEEVANGNACESKTAECDVDVNELSQEDVENDNKNNSLKEDIFEDDEFQIPIKSYNIKISKMKKTRVQTELRALEINTTGNSPDLKARLLTATGLDIEYAFDMDNDSEHYPTPAPDFGYDKHLTIPTDKKSLRAVFKTRFRHRNMWEAVEVLRHHTACPRSILYRPEELKKIREHIVYQYDREMRKRKKID